MPKRSSSPAKAPISGKWLTVSYQPVSLFSLKRSDATSMAARSNLVPTPYAIKMALLKVTLEMQGKQHLDRLDPWITQEFDWIRDLKILVLPPDRLVVNRNGYKLRYWNQQADKDYRKAHNEASPILPIQDGFVFREWVHLQGNLKFCCGISDRIEDLKLRFAQINYFGKRGCFFQYLPDETLETEKPTIQTSIATGFTVQLMDDLGAKAIFSRINPYSEEKARLGSDRTIQPDFLPLKLTSTSARYDVYTRNPD